MRKRRTPSQSQSHGVQSEVIHRQKSLTSASISARKHATPSAVATTFTATPIPISIPTTNPLSSSFPSSQPNLNPSTTSHRAQVDFDLPEPAPFSPVPSEDSYVLPGVELGFNGNTSSQRLPAQGVARSPSLEAMLKYGFFTFIFVGGGRVCASYVGD